ncbi:hypothetical protein COB64_01410 [Candidatus Wolfebacteria bacterium]|nr:MAG: hypothetical protein COB64_01410 [Candidatus Wolfebacteria bacterium]
MKLVKYAFLAASAPFIVFTIVVGVVFCWGIPADGTFDKLIISSVVASVCLLGAAVVHYFEKPANFC